MDENLKILEDQLSAMLEEWRAKIEDLRKMRADHKSSMRRNMPGGPTSSSVNWEKACRGYVQAQASMDRLTECMTDVEDLLYET